MTNYLMLAQTPLIHSCKNGMVGGGMVVGTLAVSGRPTGLD